jgi:very-short-patch-repair endonuclease
MYYGAKPEIIRLANSYRLKPTAAEEVLWQEIRKLRNKGFIFRRQHPIEFYIADFYCRKIKLVIEVDGDIHLKKEVLMHDESRSGELERFGIKVLRFKNKDVIENKKQVLNEILHKITELTFPSLTGEGDKRG